MNPIDTIAKNLSDGLYFLAFILDKIVYSFIPKLYKLIIYLANVDLFNGNPAVKALMNRVYILVGVFMLFKLAFSIVKYIVDPNAFSDQSRGFTNLVKRLLIALILLVSIPWLFEKVYEVQGKILSSNIIPNLILGTSDSEQSDIEETAKDVQFLIFGPFYTINPVGSLAVCEPSDEYPLSNIIGTTDMALKNDGECLSNLADLMDDSDDVGATDVTIENFFGEKRDFSSLGALISVYEDNQRVVNYTPVVSTLCGGYLVFLLLSFCIDVGARAIKLLFLQILSPVAVISSVDPASSSQSDKLKDWGKECLSTFASLFLRLAIIYLVIQLVKVITAKLFAGAELYNEAFRSSADTSLNIFVYIFLILGAFQVAKKIPDLIEKAFGIKMSGELQLNPFKNEGVGAFLGAAVGAGATALASGATAVANGKSPLGVVKSAVTGFGVGTVRGARGGYGKGFGDSIKAGTHSGGISSRNMLMRRDLGIDYLKHPISSLGKTIGMGVDSFLDKSGGPDLYQMQNAEVQRLNAVAENAQNLRSSVENGASSSKAMYTSRLTYEQAAEQIRVRRLALDRRASEDEAYAKSDAYLQAKEQIDTAQKSMHQSYLRASINQSLFMRDGTKIRDFDVENGLKDVESARSLLDSNDANRSIKAAHLDNLDELKKAQIDASNNSKTIQSSDSYRDSKKRHETRANVNQERFYETSGK